MELYSAVREALLRDHPGHPGSLSREHSDLKEEQGLSGLPTETGTEGNLVSGSYNPYQALTGGHLTSFVIATNKLACRRYAHTCDNLLVLTL